MKLSEVHIGDVLMVSSSHSRLDGCEGEVVDIYVPGDTSWVKLKFLLPHSCYHYSAWPLNCLKWTPSREKMFDDPE